MSEFWEGKFIENQEMWGLSPANSAIIAKDFFIEKKVKNILVPGIGYGRNAQVFLENGMEVTGIEISKTAIELARKHYGDGMKIYHGSVADMPLDNRRYDAIFCHAVIHLLDSAERKKLMQECYNQLVENGYMIFTMITKGAPTYQTGNFVSKDRYEIHQGVNMFFYDEQSIREEFGDFGLVEITEVSENLPLYLIKCKK